uniref:2OG-FeII_Oxy_2 domain-containing protein n=1 Tax=Ascaris lumbricoides TaxID=6252 RepID=A0A0M3HLY8_ASCLU
MKLPPKLVSRFQIVAEVDWLFTIGGRETIEHGVQPFIPRNNKELKNMPEAFEEC